MGTPSIGCTLLFTPALDSTFRLRQVYQDRPSDARQPRPADPVAAEQLARARAAGGPGTIATWLR